MKKRCFTALLLLAATASLGAQSLLLRMGGGLASLTGAGHRPVGSYMLGVAYEYEFDQHLTFTPGIAFQGKGRTMADRFVPMLDKDGAPVLDEAGEPRWGAMHRSETACYAVVPLLLNYYLRTGASRYVCFTFGPYLAAGIAGKAETKGDGEAQGAEKLYYSSPVFGRNGRRRADFGLEAGAAYHFNTGFSVGLVADFGLTRPYAGGGRNISGLIALGYRFRGR